MWDAWVISGSAVTVRSIYNWDWPDTDIKLACKVAGIVAWHASTHRTQSIAAYYPCC